MNIDFLSSRSHWLPIIFQSRVASCEFLTPTHPSYNIDSLIFFRFHVLNHSCWVFMISTTFVFKWHPSLAVLPDFWSLLSLPLYIPWALLVGVWHKCLIWWWALYRHLCHLFSTVWLLVRLTVNFTHSNKFLWWGMKADKSVHMRQIFRRQLNNNVHLQDDNKRLFFRIYALCLEPQDPGQVIIQVTNSVLLWRT